jgi:gingipain R
MTNAIRVLFFSALSLAASAQSTQETPVFLLSDKPGETILRIEVPRYQLLEVETPGGKAMVVTIPGGTPLLVAGAPDLPKLSANLRIPARGSMAFEVLEARFTERRQTDIAPSKGNIMRHTNPETIPYRNGEAYQQDAFFPGPLAELHKPFILGHSRGQSIWIQPVQYNPVQRTLRLYTSITIRVYQTEAPGLNELQEAERKGQRPDQSGLSDNIFLNRQADASSKKPVYEPEKLLVIAPTAFAQALQPLMDWKRQSGIHTDLVTTEAIGASDATAVYRFVQAHYEEHAMQYLLLVGDEYAIEPVMRPSGGTLYACDHCFGYLDGDDHLPEVLVGRLHAANPDQLRIMVNRILLYEKYPDEPDQNWFGSGMAAASNEGAGFGDDGQSDYAHNNEWKAIHLANDYESFWEFYDGDQSAVSPTPGHPSADRPTTPEQQELLARINGQGVSLFNYTGHGWEQGLASGNFNTQAVAAMRNTGRYPLLIAVACSTGDFTDNGGGDCLGEAWQRAGDPQTGEPWGGIAGFFSSDFQSWSPPMEGQDGMNQYLVDADGIGLHPSIGAMALYGNARMIAAYQGNGEVIADFWNPFADPTTVPRTRRPLRMAAFAPDTVQTGLSTLEVACPVEGALVGLFWQDQTLAAARVQGGVAILEFPSLEQVGNLLLTVSQFNYIPFQDTIAVVAAPGPLVVIQGMQLHDSAFNANGLADYGETLGVDLEVLNAGDEVADQVVVTLSSASPWITITSDSLEVGTLQPGQRGEFSGAFAFSVSESVPNQTVATLVFKVTYGDLVVLQTTRSIPLLAPVFRIVDLQVFDSMPGGNGNGILEPGEPTTWVTTIQNTGSADSRPAAVVLTADSPWLQPSSQVASLGALPKGQSQTANFTMLVAPDVPLYQRADVQVFVQNSTHYADRDFGPFRINPMIEHFESGDFSRLPWLLSEPHPWIITGQAGQGAYTARSGTITDNQQSVMSLAVETKADGEIEFKFRVSSEKDWDFLRFYMDGALMGQWSGLGNWETARFPVSEGLHWFRWAYEKDEIFSEGEDRAWIDDIVLPPITQLVRTTTPGDANRTLRLMPNPTDGLVQVVCQDCAREAHLTIYNTSGAAVYAGWIHPAGVLQVDLSGMPPGLYTAVVSTGAERLLLGRVIKR